MGSRTLLGGGMGRGLVLPVVAAGALLASAVSALAVPVFVPAVQNQMQIDLSISFYPSPPPIIPQGALLTGTAQFYADFGPRFAGPQLAPDGPPIDIGSLLRGGS